MSERFSTEISHDKLSREVWVFQYIEGKLYVESYSVESRKSARHGWEIRRQYDRLCRPGITSVPQIPHASVPLTGSIIRIAKDLFMSGLSVAIWEDHHKR